jgi:hypothetical protein
MVNNDNITAIIQNIFSDIKAEAIIADLIENGFEKDKILFNQEGIFKRRYSRDIDSIKNVKLENGQELLGINLNRDGLYDALPEGLFHERSEKTTSESDHGSQETKKLKQEEKATRNFFLPFENEIIHQSVQLELEERKILSQFSEKVFDDIYPELWDLHKFLDRKYVYKMVLLLHFVHKIVGNPNLTAKCLEIILEEKVEVKMIQSSGSEDRKDTNKKTDNKKCLLGAVGLGVDFVCGDHFGTYNQTMEFSIGPLKNTGITEYLENGAIAKFLTCFYGYFIAFDLDVTSTILVDQAKQRFELSEKLGGPILGFESSI